MINIAIKICKIPIPRAFYSQNYLNNDDSDKHYYLVNKTKKFHTFNNNVHFI